MRLASTSIVLLAALLAGCAALIGVDDVEDGEPVGGGGATSASSSGAGAAPGDEDCLNGVDDNGDGAVDCADDRCVDVTCAAPLLAGWSGPFVMLRGVSVDASMCEGAWGKPQLSGSITIEEPPASCSACLCAPPSQPSCGSSAVFAYTDNLCGAVAIAGAGASGVCEAVMSASVASVNVVSNLIGGTCVATPSILTTPLTTEQQAILCGGAPSGAGCFGSCWPRPPSGAQAGLCITRNGNHPCPAGYDAERVVIHQGHTDTRACAPCSCAPPPTHCPVTLAIYSDAGCSILATSVISTNSCTMAAATFAAFEATPSPPTIVSCLPSAAEAVGELTPVNPVSVCCSAVD
jgi:hypothetical protein